jgi:hypothetical protein
LTYLLDTNVVSEVRKRTPDPRVAAWIGRADADDLFLSVLVLGEIRNGIARLRSRGRPQAQALDRWLTTLTRDFGERVVPVSPAVAEAWGRLSAQSPLPTVDGLLVATALVHGLTFVTRKAGRFRQTGVPVLDPWT